jgi:hypothetical protein
VLVFVLVTSPLYAAQTFTIPQGTTVYGPFSVTTLKHRPYLSLDKSLWTNPAIKLDAAFDISSDKGSTWVFFCRFTAQGGGTIPVVIVACDVLPDSATNVRVTTVVTGGSIVLPSSPTMGTQ